MDENRYRTVFEQSLDAIVISDARGHILEANPAALQLFRVSRDDLRRMTTSDAYVQPADQEALLRRLDADGQVRSHEITLRRPDGTTFRASYSGTVWRDASGQPKGYLGVVRDLTELVDAQAARQRAEEQLRQAQKMEAIGQLAGGVAHDFNNVLAAILGTAELALLGLPPGESALRTDLETIRDSASRAAGITRQLLAFSRKQLTSPQLIEAGDAVRALEPLLAHMLGPGITVKLGAGTPCRFEMDPVQFEQALLNLASNASDAMPAGGEITIRTRFEERAAADGDVPPGAYGVIEFSDTGVGIDAATLPRIFEPFFTTKAEGEGTGLGLATVYGIVKQAGGHIQVHSTPGRGTTFRLLLPSPDRPAEREGDHAPLASYAGREAILVVEDESAVRTPVCLTLRRLGYTVIEARSAADALMLLGEFSDRVHLVITDLVMPDVGGAELIEALRLSRPYIKVLFISGYSRDFAKARGAAPDAPFLQKPFSMTDLARVVRETLDRTDIKLPSVA